MQNKKADNMFAFSCTQMTELLQDENRGIYQVKNETGEGVFTMYTVFPGVMISYNDFHMRYFDSDFVPNREVFCVDHCREGRLEYNARENAYSYVEAGDLKLDRRLTHKGHFEMPLSHYHGVTITFDMQMAQESLEGVLDGFKVNIAKLREKYCPDKYPVVMHNLPSIEHIFGELYAVPEKIKLPYFKIKILELLLYLEALEIAAEPARRPYFYKTQVEKVKAVQSFLTKHPDRNYTQEQLSRQFDISLTTMKQCFKSIYGTSIGEWMLKYRMNQAAVLLRCDRQYTVAEIAGMYGYDSPSKFAIAFRKVMGMSPTEYRNAIR